MKQTAVEWLVNEINKLDMPINDSQHDIALDIIDKAKEMEETQRKLDTFYGYAQGYDDGVANKEPMRPKLLDFKSEQEELGQHYKETFKSE